MSSLLEVRDLHAYYGKSHVLHGVALKVERGEIVSLLGRNGSGRSTLAKAIMGLVAHHGELRFEDEALARLTPFQIARRGIGYVPENRDIFPGLSVEQNLLLGRQRRRGDARWSLVDTYRLFPRLQERRGTPAGVLSGGEQQMLALCRTLMGDPRLVLIDEPTEGLAPRVIEQVARFLDELRLRGISVLLIEQKLTMALDISQRLYVMGHGTVVFEGTPTQLRADAAIRKEWLEV